MNNSTLNKAKEAKLDEFYTQLSDIENELKHYKEQFKGKTVLCNCDDPRVSNFFKYFALKFKSLGLKKLICTCYKNQDIDLFSLNNSEQAIYLVYEGTPEIDHIPTADEIQVKYLKGDGDFRSSECVELLKEADIVCTNPPFSLFREYIAQLIRFKKKFLIIGNINAISYKEVFPLLKNNTIWLGYSFNVTMEFGLPEKYEKFDHIDENGVKIGVVPAIAWFTNLDVTVRHENLILYKHYSEDEYTSYDNYEGIDVGKVADIPMDYDGVMGVPLTFLGSYNPEQFEIIGYGKGELARSIGVKSNHRGRCDLAITREDGTKTCPYGRILIRRKQ